MYRIPGPRGRIVALALAPLLVVAAAVDAQRGPDFMFHEPNGTISLYGGWSMPREGSDIFDHLREWQTVNPGDFAAPVFGADVGFHLTSRLDAVLGLEYSSTQRHSELHDWLEDGWPIEQTTEFGYTRATAGARVYLLERGRGFGSLAWVPTRWSPFVGGGGGFVWHNFEMFGDFVDADTLDDPEGALIISEHYQSRGTSGTAHVLAGLDITLTPRILLRGEYRYHWGSAALDSRDFRGFEPIDLAGHRAAIGIATRF